MGDNHISDTARNRTHNLFCPKCVPIPIGLSDGVIGCIPLTRNIKYHKNRWWRCLAAVGNVPDNTGYKILPDTGYQIIPDIVLYWKQNTGSNQIPDSIPYIHGFGKVIDEARWPGEDFINKPTYPEKYQRIFFGRVIRPDGRFPEGSRTTST